MLMRRRYFIVLAALSWVASNLTLTVPVSRPATAQAQADSGSDAEHDSSSKERKEKATVKKPVIDPEPDPIPPSRGFKGLGKDFLLAQEQIWTSPAKIRFSDTQWLVPFSGITAGLFVTDTSYSK